MRSWLLRLGWGCLRRSRDLHLADRDGRRALGDVEGQQRERVLLACGLHRPPDRMAAAPAGRQRALVAKRALEAAKCGEDDSALVRLVVVLEQVAGHAPTLPRRRRPDIGRPPWIGHPDFSLCGP